jgi:ubiquinone/menaquinone biosynthesis C-methylase UbiE
MVARDFTKRVSPNLEGIEKTMNKCHENTQDHGEEPLDSRDTGLYQQEYVQSFVEKWDELIDWNARAESEGRFFIDILKAREKHKILDVATGTGFHSVQLLKANFDVTSADGNAKMLTKAFENARDKDLMLQTVHADWR